MIEVKYLGGLGNNLFQYCLGRILAIEMGYALLAKPIKGFPATAEIVRGDKFQSPATLLTGHQIDFDEIIKRKIKEKIILSGYFQRIEYYKKYKHLIAEWLRTDSNKSIAFNPNDIVLNLRLGDYKLFRVNALGMIPLPETYINRLLSQGNWAKKFIVTDSPNDILVQKISRRWSATIVNGDPLDDFNFMKSAPNLIISLSSFSWWAAWLSGARKVYFPLMGIWDTKIRPDVNLAVDESRYFYPSVTILERFNIKLRVNSVSRKLLALSDRIRGL